MDWRFYASSDFGLYQYDGENIGDLSDQPRFCTSSGPSIFGELFLAIQNERFRETNPR
jgi:hypothetical protein